MSRLFIAAIVFAAAPLSLAAAEPSPSPSSSAEGTPPATCPQMPMHQSGQAGMQNHMGNGAMNGSGQMMQHGQGGMGGGSMGSGNMDGGHMQGQMMQNGGNAGMGHGNHQAMMQGQGQCPGTSQSPSDPPQSGQ